MPGYRDTEYRKNVSLKYSIPPSCHESGGGSLSPRAPPMQWSPEPGGSGDHLLSFRRLYLAPLGTVEIGAGLQAEEDQEHY